MLLKSEARSIIQAYVLEAEDWDDEEDYEHTCPACGGPGVPLGSLGRLQHFKCRNCGMTFSSREPVSKDKKEKKAKEKTLKAKKTATGTEVTEKAGLDIHYIDSKDEPGVYKKAHAHLKSKGKTTGLIGGDKKNYELGGHSYTHHSSGETHHIHGTRAAINHLRAQVS